MKKAKALMVVAPAFTADSESQAKLYQIQTGNQICLITATELKAVTIPMDGFEEGIGSISS